MPRYYIARLYIFSRIVEALLVRHRLARRMTDIRTRHQILVGAGCCDSDPLMTIWYAAGRKLEFSRPPDDRDILAEAISPPSRSRELNGHLTGSSAAVKPVRWIGNAIQRATNPAVDGRASPTQRRSRE